MVNYKRDVHKLSNLIILFFEINFKMLTQETEGKRVRDEKANITNAAVNGFIRAIVVVVASSSSCSR